MEARLHHARSEDAAMLARAADGVFEPAINPGRLAEYLAAPGHHLIVAVQDGIVVGQIAAVVHRHADKPRDLFIDELRVAPAHRRQGLARRLLSEMLALGLALGCEEAWLGTHYDNIPARALYETLARQEDGVLMYAFDTDRT